ncbi:hypothetical protein SAY87_003783 [Trapa incisa]|uniref:Uncharacterized protein n=1 Tax=Trapa incisa TaxID=236973 RepID=A0AAN7KLF8_9MYRT|nr:hypothetical protein SAY87_003783 [Trapa incisa]
MSRNFQLLWVFLFFDTQFSAPLLDSKEDNELSIRFFSSLVFHSLPILFFASSFHLSTVTPYCYRVYGETVSTEIIHIFILLNRYSKVWLMLDMKSISRKVGMIVPVS